MTKDQKTLVMFATSIVVAVGLAIFLLVFSNWLGKKVSNHPAEIDQLSDGEIQQIEFLGQPKVKPFQPNKKFVVMEREVGENVFLAELPLTMFLVKRTNDNAIFRVIAKNYSRNPSLGLHPKDEVKLYNIFWRFSLSGEDGFLYAVHPWEIRSSQPLTKNPK